MGRIGLMAAGLTLCIGLSDASRLSAKHMSIERTPEGGLRFPCPVPYDRQIRIAGPPIRNQEIVLFPRARLIQCPQVQANQDHRVIELVGVTPLGPDDAIPDGLV